MEDTNFLLESISEGTYIVSVLGPILNKFFIKNKKSWRVKYGETCLRASAKDRNSQKMTSADLLEMRLMQLLL